MLSISLDDISRLIVQASGGLISNVEARRLASEGMQRAIEEFEAQEAINCQRWVRLLESIVSCIDSARMRHEVGPILEKRRFFQRARGAELEELKFLADAICVDSFSLDRARLDYFVAVANENIASRNEDWQRLQRTLERSGLASRCPVIFKPPEKIDLEEIDRLPRHFHVEETPLTRFLLSAPPETRLHFCDTMQYLLSGYHAYMSLLDSTYFRTREFGVDIARSAQLLLASDLFESTVDRAHYFCNLPKKDLRKLADEFEILAPQSWTRRQIFDRLNQAFPERLSEVLRQEICQRRLVTLSQMTRNLFQEWQNWKLQTYPAFDFLLFRLSDVEVGGQQLQASFDGTGHRT